MISRHPWGDLADPSWAGSVDLTVLGIPYDGGVGFRAGAAQAPARLRAISSTSALVSEEGHVVDKTRFRVRDVGDVPPPLDAEGKPDGSEAGRAAYFEKVQAAARREMESGFVVSIGGDHSVHIPLARAFAQAHPEGYGTVLLDAHPDLFDTYEGSKTSHACPLRRALETGALRPEHLVILGVRSYNPVEVDFMEEAGIRFVPARELQRMGMEAAGELARERLRGLQAVYLTVDIDVADPSCAPGTGYPVAGGLLSRELIDLTRGLVEALPVKAMDLVEVAPPLDPAGVTEWLALQLIFETIAARARRKGLTERPAGKTGPLPAG